jgi:hypothetical protein
MFLQEESTSRGLVSFSRQAVPQRPTGSLEDETPQNSLDLPALLRIQRDCWMKLRVRSELFLL